MISMRVGIGFDAHRFTPHRPLILGGVRVREHHGLAGHSDADVLVHAVIDALLGAAGMDDIGTLFPDSDPALAGADSLLLLRRVGARLAKAGVRILNVDAVVICEDPKISPHRTAMREGMAAALEVPVSAISVKGKTAEGMGFTGRGEGIAAQAVALALLSVGDDRDGSRVGDEQV
ncbi:MAG: 2-C-methyl-D-erythritol 2,4-cyclodiphosphate synthase [Actinobacteria bacterium]|nr:2-C-methyl-D-erythritol 2,4-cyclodiphosphate synthase [Actinomycetota bacterium]